MSAFALRDISLTKIESRPLRGRPYEYRFYVDILGVPSEVNCANALRHLEEMTESLAVLGSYRVGGSCILNDSEQGWGLAIIR